jgi:hypothetical protein
MKNKLPIFLSAFMLFVLACLCSGAPAVTPHVVTQPPTNGNPPTAIVTTPTPIPTPVIYKVGEAIDFGGATITLNTAAIQPDNILFTEFLIENKGTKNLDISSMLMFNARNSDGTKLDQEFVNCGSSLDGTILPGDKLKGNVCWNKAADDVKIYFQPALFNDTIIVWEIKK